MLANGENIEYEKKENGQIGPNKRNIFNRRNEVYFKGYEEEKIQIKYFWSSNNNSYEVKNKLKKQIMELELKNEEELTNEEYIKLEKLKEAERAIDIYEFVSGVDKKIDCFIEMLSYDFYTQYKAGSPDNNNIFKHDNKIKFKGYDEIKDINTSNFWVSNDNSIKIKARIKEIKNELEQKSNKTEEEKKKIEQLQKAGKAIDDYEFTTNLERRIDCFIEMLSEDNLIKYENGEAKKNNNIFRCDTKIPFKGYESIDGLNARNFWTKYSDDIKKRIKELKKILERKENFTDEEKDRWNKLKNAEDAIDCYEFTIDSNINRRIDCFIEMLADEQNTQYEDGKTKKGNNIFRQDSKNSFKGYGKIHGLNTGNFWSTHSDEIKKRIEELKKLLNNKESLTDEENDRWNTLKIAEKAIKNYEFLTILDKRIECYIEMLCEEEYTSYKESEKGKKIPNLRNIFSQKREIEFKGYEKIDGLYIKGFWSEHSVEIISRLFYNTDEKGNKLEKDYKISEYDKARQAILEYAKVESIDEYIEKQKNEKKKNQLISLRENTSNLTMSDVERAGKVVRGILDKDKEIA